MRKVDTVIIGGGITGLSVASFLGKDHDYLVLEGSPEMGGYCKTKIQNGFVWDYSGHFFHFRDKSIKDYMFENIDCEVVEVDKITDIDYNRNIVDFPFQWNIHQLSKHEFIECLYDMYNANKDVDKTSFKSFVRTSLGSATSDKFLIPYNEKLYATDLDNLDGDAMGRFFPKSIDFGQLLENIRNPDNSDSYNSSFVYPVKGSYEFIKSLLKRVDDSKIKVNSKVVSIDNNSKTIVLDDGEVIGFNNLVSTTSFKNILKMQNTDENLDSLSSNKVAVFNLGFDGPTNIKTHWRYFPGDEVFYRVGFYNNILGQDRMSLYVEIGAKTNDELSEEQLLERVKSDLFKVGIIQDQQLTDHQFIVMDPAYVHITKDSNRMYEEWSNKNNPNNIYSIGRYGSWTYCSIEDNILQAKSIVKSIKNNH
tara:strand:+ start:976 stop:2238 length:1263 start_codon:yes stop_codon:yes gene_type:complete